MVLLFLVPLGNKEYNECGVYIPLLVVRWWCATSVDASGEYTDWDYCPTLYGSCPLEGKP